MILLVIAGIAYRYPLMIGAKDAAKTEALRAVHFFPNLLVPTSQETVFKD